MANSAKRAKRKRLAQEAQRREACRPAHQMDPADLSDPSRDRERRGGRSGNRISLPETECGGAIADTSESAGDHRLRNNQYGENVEWGDSRSFIGYGPDSEGLQSTADRKYSKRQSPDRPLRNS